MRAITAKTDIQRELYEYITAHGISIRFISNKTGINYEMLRRSLHSQRSMTANELVKILGVLGVKLEDIGQ